MLQFGTRCVTTANALMVGETLILAGAIGHWDVPACEYED